MPTMWYSPVAPAGASPALPMVMTVGSLQVSRDVFFSACEYLSPLSFHSTTITLLDPFIILRIEIALSAFSLLLSKTGGGEVNTVA